MFRYIAALCISATPIATGWAQPGMLLVGNKAEDTISFIDRASGKEVARQPTRRMPDEVAVSPDGKQAAIVNYGGTTIDVFDIASRSKSRTIELLPNRRPHGLLWLRDGRLVATTEGSRSVTMVHPDGKQQTIVTAADGSHMIAVSPDQQTAYVANIDSGTVSILDLARGVKLRDLQVGGEPEGWPSRRTERCCGSATPLQSSIGCPSAAAHPGRAARRRRPSRERCHRPRY